jgi:hypothetical protein
LSFFVVTWVSFCAVKAYIRDMPPDEDFDAIAVKVKWNASVARRVSFRAAREMPFAL